MKWPSALVQSYIIIETCTFLYYSVRKVGGHIDWNIILHVCTYTIYMDSASYSNASSSDSNPLHFAYKASSLITGMGLM